MSEIVVRLVLLFALSAGIGLVVLLGKYFVALRRRQALAAAPLREIIADGNVSVTGDVDHYPLIRILAFGSDDCQQCKRLQAPALERVLAARRGTVVVTDVDATIEHKLTQAYHVLTVPSTVVLDAAGRAHAVNYGFANTQRLLQQIDEIAAKVSAKAS
jgi:Thioredoxin.